MSKTDYQFGSLISILLYKHTYISFSRFPFLLVKAKSSRQRQTKNMILHYYLLTTIRMSDTRNSDAAPPIEEQVIALNLQLLNHELPGVGQYIVDQNLGRPLEKFTCFGKLPYELRHMIWDFKLPRRQVVDFKPFFKGMWDDKSQPKLPLVCL
ncbi:MAG: hypothetical protein CL912_30985 [Deltaproteobacteria bacterium]|nr:hypothetical protein [Deltaproteobacteria bacterium]